MCDLIYSKRCRTRFSAWQIDKLEKVFSNKTHYPDSRQTEMLSKETGIPITKMQIWFQNRRAKWRKHSRLRNFGGLERVNQSEFVPAPNEYDTIKSLQQLSENITAEHQHSSYLSNYFNSAIENQDLCKEKKAIDLSISATLKASAALSSSYSSSLSPCSTSSMAYPLSSFYLIPPIPISTQLSTPMSMQMPISYNDKSQVYKHLGHEESYFSNHMNAFEYVQQQQQQQQQGNENGNEIAAAFASNTYMMSPTNE